MAMKSATENLSIVRMLILLKTLFYGFYQCHGDI
jgi:hypothetical protein